MNFICDQIPALEAQITALQNAALDLAAGNIQSFSFNSGQTQENVTKFDIDKLNNVIDSLYNRYVILRGRCGCGNGTLIARPSW